MRRASVWGFARWAFVAVALALVVPAVRRQWDAYAAAAGALRPDWWLVAASALVVLATYALLVQAWRALVASWGGRLGFLRAVHIWTVSNLGRYVPGKVWSIGMMGAMARDAGVSPVAAAGSALVGTFVNLGAGTLVAVATGASLIGDGSPRARTGALAVAVASAAGCAALPWVLPWAVGAAGRVLGRTVAVPPRAPGVYFGVLAANLLSWAMYGLAFHLLARALVPPFAGRWSQAVAVFTISYLAGYFTVFAPGGLVAREVAMVALLTRAGLASHTDATLLAVGSRLWLTALEIGPGLLFLVAGRRRSPGDAPAPHPLDAPTR